MNRTKFNSEEIFRTLFDIIARRENVKIDFELELKENAKTEKKK